MSGTFNYSYSVKIVYPEICINFCISISFILWQFVEKNINILIINFDIKNSSTMNSICNILLCTCITFIATYLKFKYRKKIMPCYRFFINKFEKKMLSTVYIFGSSNIFKEEHLIFECIIKKSSCSTFSSEY